MATIIFANFIYFCNISFSRSLLLEINDFLSTGPNFTPEIYILCKKVWEPRWRGTVNFDITFIIQSLCTDKHL